jgi:xylose isomerase
MQGSLLLTENGEIIRQEVCHAVKVLDETGAGDNFRAAFVVAHFVEGKGLRESLEFASASGSVAVSKMGAQAVGSREEVLTALDRHRALRLRGGARGLTGGSARDEEELKPFPFKFASRLNSMKDRGDLWSGEQDVCGWVRRQGLVRGLDLVDFNYPQHMHGPVTYAERMKLEQALRDSGLACGAVCLRFPKELQLGAFTHPDKLLREKAIRLTKEACEWALALGAEEVIVWSAFDGYDYHLQTDYRALWQDVLAGFREVCDAYPGVRVSLEYKPTDENTRFFAVPSTGAAVLLERQVDRPNFGLVLCFMTTFLNIWVSVMFLQVLDFGHCLMAGENPAQAVAMVPQGKLFGVQLGDGYGRLGAEDGLVFGSVHHLAALEFVLWLVRTDYRGHIYFDTFPRNEDPVRECEFNIRQFKRMYRLANHLLASPEFTRCQTEHDAMGMLELLEKLDAI